MVVINKRLSHHVQGVYSALEAEEHPMLAFVDLKFI